MFILTCTFYFQMLLLWVVILDFDQLHNFNSSVQALHWFAVRSFLNLWLTKCIHRQKYSSFEFYIKELETIIDENEYLKTHIVADFSCLIHEDESEHGIPVSVLETLIYMFCGFSKIDHDLLQCIGTEVHIDKFENC